MTEQKPTTLSIDQSEWRVLFASSVQRMQEFVGQNQVLSVEHLPLLLDHLDRAKVLATAWQRASVPAQPAQEAAPVQTNGAEPAKKRRGRPTNAEREARRAMQ